MSTFPSNSKSTQNIHFQQENKSLFPSYLLAHFISKSGNISGLHLKCQDSRRVPGCLLQYSPSFCTMTADNSGGFGGTSSSPIKKEGRKEENVHTSYSIPFKMFMHPLALAQVGLQEGRRPEFNTSFMHWIRSSRGPTVIQSSPSISLQHAAQKLPLWNAQNNIRYTKYGHRL